MWKPKIRSKSHKMISHHIVNSQNSIILGFGTTYVYTEIQGHNRLMLPGVIDNKLSIISSQHEEEYTSSSQQRKDVKQATTRTSPSQV